MPKPPSIVLGQIVQLGRGQFRVMSYGKGCFRIRDERTGDEEVIHHLELARELLPGESLRTEDAKPKPPLFNQVNSLDDTARILAVHLQQLLDEDVPAIGRMAAKVEELEALGIKISEGTLRRRLRSYRALGVVGLSDGRSTKPKRPLSRTDRVVVEILGEMLNDHLGRSTITYSKIRSDLRDELTKRFPDAEARPTTPSLSTVIRLVRLLAGDQNPTHEAARRETDALVPKRTFRPRGVTAPGDECQVDTTVFDALVRMPDGKVERPHLTILLDRKTRSILSHAFTVGAPTGYDHALLLANALVPRRSRPWAKDYESLQLPEMPWAKHLTTEQRAGFDAHRPYIFPRRILIDNGQDYRSLVFRAACERYGISITEAPPQSPTSKAHVERNFATINTKFTQYLPGYVGGNIASRGRKAQSDAVMSLRELDDLFERWTGIVWQNREHGGLRDNDDPSLRHTPNTMFMASVALTGHFTVALQEDDFISLMPSTRRVVQSDGISLNSRTYDSPHLIPYRRRRDINGAALQVEVHFDPTDHHQVWVRGEDNAWITCRWTALPGMQRPLDSELMQRAAEYTRGTVTFSDDKADEILGSLRRAVEDETAEREKEERERERALRRNELRAARRAEAPDANEDDEDDGFEMAVA
ncbi:DDE-type integrase/transposase/recombinase [Microbacterium sp. C5A9]|uniref:Mu transposase C-terminal domain-containing protein n=1 Tax=Microbacterium sp. C5A9 TaxID=2736663 RepID=UPI001F521E1F|nr:Mu transposase C-terminal domain-containing protein [Microbacterium sp. C5A9]MCI1017362.1 DDE-type integrase/transposase/recombinase [Microbacterium sp. C5A9]